MDLANLIRHPERLDHETLYELRGLVALYPYFQTARLLLLQNLYLLHDPSFNDELRNAALSITDRRVIFNLVEAGHYKLKEERRNRETFTDTKPKASANKPQGEDRTLSLIDNFLDSLPEDEKEETEKKKKRKPTAADAAVDYVSYLLATESEEEKEEEERNAPQMKGQELIDNFINNEGGKIKLKDEPEFTPDIEEESNDEDKADKDGYFTQTLAKIYIRQGRYDKALEIIRRLNLNYPKKNSYFADQIRFLEKLILNSKNNK